jgi:hypothetical protein
MTAVARARNGVEAAKMLAVSPFKGSGGGAKAPSQSADRDNVISGW